jgi:transposase
MGKSNGQKPLRHELLEAKSRARSERGNSTAVRRSHPDANGARPVIDWNQAFAYYAALPTSERSYRAVAREYRVSEHTVGKWAARDEWEARVKAIEARARAKVDRRAVRSLADRMETVVRAADATMAVYAQQLQAGEVKVSPQDVVALAKLQQLLEGHADSRVETVFAEVVNLSDDELEQELERMKQLDNASEEV